MRAQILGVFASGMAQGNQISKERILELLEVEISLVEVEEKMLDGGGISFVNSNI
jgi:hypothetical protein